MVLLEEETTRSILGGFYASYNKLGYGFLENVCVGGLVIELERRGHKVQREVPIAVYYDGAIIGSYKADLVVDNKVIVEVKSEAALTAVHVRQTRNYLSATDFEIALVLVYGIKPQFKRLIHTRHMKERKSVVVSAQSESSVGDSPTEI